MSISSNSPSKICKPLSKLALDSSHIENSLVLQQRLTFQKKNISAQIFEDFSLSQNPKEQLEFRGFIRGPSDTPYQSGKFYISIKIPKEYPFKAPKFKFETKIYHPNVSKSTGYLSCHFLTDAWSPTMTLVKITQQTIKLLKSPDLSGSYETQIANIYQKNLKTFKTVAKEWTETYAK